MEDGITEAYASVVEMYGNVSRELALARHRVNELAAEVSDLSAYNKRLKGIADSRALEIDKCEEVIDTLSNLLVDHTNFTYDDLHAIEMEVRVRFEEGDEE